ncbi:MAG: hypothetical protein KY476_23210 [Planctomycetes bacterium]|nr:hypothetical protein [Planctomycetota bacterium]
MAVEPQDNQLEAEPPFDIRDTYAAQDAASAHVWNDPELDLYNDYDTHRPE